MFARDTADGSGVSVVDSTSTVTMDDVLMAEYGMCYSCLQKVLADASQSFLARYDTDGSGSIDVRELRALMQEVTSEEPTDAETAMFVRAVDTDGNGSLSFDEFNADLEDFM